MRAALFEHRAIWGLELGRGAHQSGVCGSDAGDGGVDHRVDHALGVAAALILGTAQHGEQIELAQGGTLFLDEIGDLPLELQGKLLRLLQERAFERVGGRETLTADVRVVAATHVDLERAVKEKRFREDLYYRLRVLEIDVPRLSDRGPDEIERLALHFVERFARRHQRPDARLGPDAIAVLRAHSFPGNVRELEHWIESAMVLSPDGLITASRLPRIRLVASDVEPSTVSIPEGLSLEDASNAYIRRTVQALGGNQSEAARKLGISRNTVARALKR